MVPCEAHLPLELLGVAAYHVHVSFEPPLRRIQPSDAVRDALHPPEADLEALAQRLRAHLLRERVGVGGEG
jgi:hypothetical protein